MLLKNKIGEVGIIKDMFDTPNAIRNFDKEKVRSFLSGISSNDRFILSGEGSSRTFPSKKTVYRNFVGGSPIFMHSEGSTQCLEYNLKDFVLMIASNSGKTKEAIRLIKEKKDQFKQTIGVTATPNSMLEQVCTKTFVLGCGKENAVAATKSVVEQALFEDYFFRLLVGDSLDFEKLATNVESVLNIDISDDIISKLKNASTVYIAGREDGVGEELTTKSKEIIRKRAVFLEGTYLLHGTEEVMQKDDTLILIEPFAQEEALIKELIEDKIGVNVIAISSRDTLFSTIKLPQNCKYLELVCGWNLLVQTALTIGVDPSNPLRARKIGNEFV